MKELKEGRLTELLSKYFTMHIWLNMCFCKADRKERKEKRGWVIKEG